MIEIHSYQENYPSLLKRLSDYPDKIYYEGELNLLNPSYIAVVGARNIQPWVRDWMENELFTVIKNNKIGILSGGARGVDQWAHWLCLRAGRPTLVVLPSGLSQKYPQTIEKLSGRSQVGFISEYSQETQMKKHFFYKRNRLIAALTHLTLVIQASEKSGTMITAKYAIELGNTVATLPGHPLDQTVNGNNQILFDGGAMIRDRFDLEVLIKSLYKNI